MQLNRNAAGSGEVRVFQVAGVASSGGFEDEERGLRIGASAMLGAARNNVKVAFVENDDVVAVLDAHLSAPDKKELFDVVMVMPGKFAQDLDEFQLLAIERRNDLGPPVFANGVEFLRD